MYGSWPRITILAKSRVVAILYISHKTSSARTGAVVIIQSQYISNSGGV